MTLELIRRKNGTQIISGKQFQVGAAGGGIKINDNDGNSIIDMNNQRGIENKRSDGTTATLIGRHPTKDETDTWNSAAGRDVVDDLGSE